MTEPARARQRPTASLTQRPRSPTVSGSPTAFAFGRGAGRGGRLGRARRRGIDRLMWLAVAVSSWFHVMYGKSVGGFATLHHSAKDST